MEIGACVNIEYITRNRMRKLNTLHKSVLYGSLHPGDEDEYLWRHSAEWIKCAVGLRMSLLI